MNPIIDDKDLSIFWTRYAAFMARPSLLGHYVQLPDGTFDRITHQWDDKAQAGGNGRSYYIGGNGLSYSGGLNSGYSPDRLRFTHKLKKGSFWIFHHDYPTAHNGVYFAADCRVYELTEGEL